MKMNPSARLAAAMAFALCVGGTMVGCGPASPEATPGSKGRPHGEAGLRIYIDEEGKPVQPPKDDATEAAAPDPMRGPELQEEPVPIEGGGWLVPLDERFMSSTVATLEPDGSVRIDCTPGDGAGHVHDDTPREDRP